MEVLGPEIEQLYLTVTIMKKFSAALILIICRAECYGQSEADTSSILQKIYTLGEVNVSATGIENVYKAGNKLSFIPGVSYNLRKSLKAEDYNSTNDSISNYPANKNDALNAQLATYYKISDAINLSFNIAYKSRFATMKDRYSYRNGTALPNPELKSETALNLELASTLKLPTD